MGDESFANYFHDWASESTSAGFVASLKTRYLMLAPYQSVSL
jgi:hypothetical protein